jgi:hypothetical protein
MRKQSLLFVSGIFTVILRISLSINAADIKPAGVIIYKDHPQSGPELTFAMEFTYANRFPHVVNAKPLSGGEVRQFLNNRVISVIKYINLEAGNIVSPDEIELLKRHRKNLERCINSYQNTRPVLSARVRELLQAEDLISQGILLYQGRWTKRSDVLKPSEVANNNVNGKSSSSKVILNGRTFDAGTLYKVTDNEITIRHSSGFSTLRIDSLTSNEIGFLNSTSTSVSIKTNGLGTFTSTKSADSTPTEVLPMALAKEDSPTAFSPDQFRRQITALLPDISSCISVDPNQGWTELSDEIRLDLKKIKEDASDNIGGMPNEDLYLSIAVKFVDAVIQSDVAAGQWAREEGREAAKSFSQIEFPANFAAVPEFEQSWKTLGSLSLELLRRAKIYDDAYVEIREGLENKKIATPELIKRINSLLTQIPDAKLSTAVERISKDSLGL